MFNAKFHSSFSKDLKRFSKPLIEKIQIKQLYLEGIKKKNIG